VLIDLAFDSRTKTEADTIERAKLRKHVFVHREPDEKYVPRIQSDASSRSQGRRRCSQMLSKFSFDQQVLVDRGALMNERSEIVFERRFLSRFCSMIFPTRRPQLI
jgi:hypothetical protein